MDGANIGDYSLNCPDAAADNAIPLQFGRDAANQDPSFLGLIDEAAIYDRALTPEEINQQYLGGITLGPVEGGHLLSYYSVDNVGNKEPAARVALVVDSSGPAAITDLAAVARTTHSVTIAWSAPEDIGALGKLGKYAIGCSTAQEGLSLEQALTIIPAGPEETSGSPKAHTIGNLAEGTAYYLAVWSMDGLGNPSGISNAVSTRTYHFETSPDGLMGVTSPETEISVALASTETAKPAYAALAQGGLAMAVSAFYDLQPDNILVEPPAELRFIFNPVDVDTATLAIYRFDGVSWSSASVSGQKIEYLAGGSAVITGWINRTSLYTALYRKDRMAPRTELTARGYKAGEAEYVRKDTIFALTSIDDLAAANDGIGLGVKRQRVEVRSQMSEVRELTFVNSEPKPGATFASTFTLAGEADGFYSLSYNAEDVLGSAEQVKTGAFALDNTPPVSAISAGSPRFTAFGLTVITPDTPITLSAGDPAVNDTASGLKDIQYAIEALGDGSAGEPAAYTEPVRIASQGVFIIRYWSRDNVNNGEAPKEMRLAVTTLQQDALIAAGGLKMTGAAEITGKVESNGVAALSGDTRIAGDVAAGTITLAGNAQITGRRTAGVTPVNPVPIELLDITQAVGSSNNNDLLAAKYLINGRLTASGKAVITLSAGTYYLKGIKLTGGSSIVLAGPVAMLIEGEISLSGGSLLNAGGAASKLNIFVSTDSTLDFTGGGSLTAYLYAPYSDLKLSGNAVLAGHYFVKSGTLSGTGNLIQSGETPPLITASLPDGGKKGVSAIGGFSVLSAGPDPAFKPGEVYVFPDPAKGGAAPTFHIECGVADKVAIKIYTVSGRLAHETTLTGLPQIIDDGNGSEYAYEYAWNEHIPSGIYYYYIEAEKAGKDLKKAGKFAVVR